MPGFSFCPTVQPIRLLFVLQTLVVIRRDGHGTCSIKSMDKRFNMSAKVGDLRVWVFETRPAFQILSMARKLSFALSKRKGVGVGQHETADTFYCLQECWVLFLVR